ncbi:serine/threonine protein kinase Sgk2 [Histoplasma capsulatum var. duboisii H88]|uniref:Serine/threonine protein kinase Sgk2 n=1 Tax=Ajellomyces capsulatus (strain H88) TaxID=544711 RepID=F0UFZ5_AJEC8|nr:serine/threonine protein kinase Sgk2 [Histoplasma capsulatum var. duboisii H88]
MSSSGGFVFKKTFFWNHTASTTPQDILVVGKLKKSMEEIKTKGTLLQMSCYVHKVFTAQLTQQFVHMFTICGTKMKVWVFNCLGLYSSSVIDVYENSRQFFQMLVSYTMMSDEELELNIFIARDEGSNKSITIKESENSEEKMLQLGEMLFFQCAIWQLEVELLKLAGQQNVQGVARIIGYSTITNITDMCCNMAFDDRCHNFKSTSSSTIFLFHQSQLLTESCCLDICQKSSSRKCRSLDKRMQAFKQSHSINQTLGDIQEHLAFSVQSAHKSSLFDRNDEELKLHAWYTGNYEDIANTKLGHMSKAENMRFEFILREFSSKLHGVVLLCRIL